MLLGNGIRLVDWSKDGEYLLFDVLRWQWGSDAPPSNEVWVYLATTGIFKQIDLNEKIAGFGKDCLVSVDPLGFAANGQVAVRLSAIGSFEPDTWAPKPGCSVERQTWLFDPRKDQLFQAPEDYPVTKWGTLQAPRKPEK